MPNGHQKALDVIGEGRNIETARRILSSSVLALKQKNFEEMDRHHTAFLRFLEKNLFTDGSTYDFREHDSLPHHLECLECSYRIAKTLSRVFPHKDYIRHTTSSFSSSLWKATTFLLPYIQNKKKHILFYNSTHTMDMVRYRGVYGRRWTPYGATPFLGFLKNDFPNVLEELF